MTKSNTTLKNWSLAVRLDNPYQAPEVRLARLQGAVYGHPVHKDGSVITTSPIMSTNGRWASTQNTMYFVEGEPSNHYQLRLLKSGYMYDPEDPLTPKKH